MWRRERPTTNFNASLQENLSQGEKKKTQQAREKQARKKQVDSELQQRGHTQDVALLAEQALSTIRQEIPSRVGDEIVPVVEEAHEAETQEVEAQATETTEASALLDNDNLQNKMQLLLSNTAKFVSQYKARCEETKTGFAARMPYNVARLNAADFIERLSSAFALQVGTSDEFSSDVVVNALEAGFLIELKKLVDEFDLYNTRYTSYFFRATSLDQTVLSSMLCDRLNMTEKEYRTLDRQVLVTHANCLDDCLGRMISANTWTEDAYTREIRQRINDIRSGSEQVAEEVVASIS